MSLFRRSYHFLRKYLIRIPVIGYVLRIMVAIVKLPKVREQIMVQVNLLTEGHAHQLSTLEGKQAAFDQHLPTLLNTISSYNASSRQLKRYLDALESKQAAFDQGLSRLGSQQNNGFSELGRLGERIEFARRETLFEFKYGASKPVERSWLVEPKIINQDKISNAEANGLLRLNLGCGDIPINKYINVDRRELPGVDMVASGESLPFEEESVDEIFSAHLIEHFPQEQLRRAVLPHWHKLLKAGGLLRAVVPDADTMMGKYIREDYSFDELREVTFGAQDYEGDFHYNMFSQDSLRQLLKDCGFSSVEFPVVGRRNGACYEMEVHARKQSGKQPAPTKSARTKYHRPGDSTKATSKKQHRRQS